MHFREFKKIFLANRYPLYAFILIFIVLLTNQVYSIYLHRPLYHEGADWFYRIINEKKLFWDNRFYRYSDLLLQLPAHLSDVFFSNDSPQLKLYLLDFFYTIHPHVSLLACLAILNCFKRWDLVYFPLFSYVVICIPTSLFSLGMGAQIHSLFWPLFLLLLLTEKYKAKNLIGLIVLIVLYNFIHEVTALTMPLLIYVIWKKSPRQLLVHTLLGSLLFFSFCFQIYSAIRLPEITNSGSIYIDFRYMTYFVTFLTLNVLFYFLFICFGLIHSNKLRYSLAIITAILIVCFNVYYLTQIYMPLSSYFTRILRLFVSPLMCIVAALCVLIELYYKKRWLNFIADKVTLHVLILVLLTNFSVATYVDLENTAHWKQLTQTVEIEISKHTGCYRYPLNRQDKAYAFFGKNSQMSILLQESRVIKTTLTNYPTQHCKSNETFCSSISTFSNTNITDCPLELMTSKNGYFDFNKIIKKVNN